MLKIGVQTNVVDQMNFAHTLDVMDEMGVEYIDLRDFYDKNIVDFSDEEIQDIRGLIKKHGFKVACISPWVFCHLDLREREDDVTILGTYLDNLQKLKRGIELAKLFDTNLVRCFSFQNVINITPGTKDYATHTFDVWEKQLERFQKPAQLAKEAGVTLAMENCHHSNTPTGIMVCKFIDDLGSKNIRLLWDPCNSVFASGENPFPYEYDKVKDYIVDIDIKDTVVDKWTCSLISVQLGHGNRINWPSILQTLIKDNYQGVLTLETHYVPEGGTWEEGTKEFCKILKQMLTSLE